MLLDNYIIRIYRRDKAAPRLMVGTVEEIGQRILPQTDSGVDSSRHENGEGKIR